MSGPSSDALKALEKASAAAGRAELPGEGEFHYYRNFKGFKDQIDGFRGRLQTLLTSLPDAGAPPPTEVFNDPDEAGDWVTSLLDSTLEQVDDAVAAARRALQAGPAAEAASGAPLLPSAVAQLPASVQAAAGWKRAAAAAAGGNVGAGGSAGDGFVSYMNSQLQQRPQESFADAVDNSRAPFQHKLDSLAGVIDVEAAAADAVAAAAAGLRRPHPLQQQLEGLQYPAWQLAVGEAQPPRSYEDTPFTFIDTVPALRAAAQRLAAAKEVAIDLEAHSYRSFQGFCCLMQLSTRSEDMVIDTLALRPHIGPALAPVLADPAVVKVLHGADSDIVWLQRDYGLFVVNLFDTGQASRVLDMKGNGLAHLLDFYCSFKADKRFQLADWRIRPLTEEMLHYARSDTHYLLYCYDRLRAALVEAGTTVPEHLAVQLPPAAQAAAAAPGSSVALATVLERSRQLCLLQYEREQYNPHSFMELFTKLNATLTDEQLSVFAALYEWRDSVCRQLDESTGFVLARAQLLKLALAMPRTALELHRAVGRSSTVISRKASELLAVVQAARRPEAVAAVKELRQQPWKQVLAAEQQQAQTSAATAAGVAPAAASSEQQQQQQQQSGAQAAAPAAVAVAATSAVPARPALQPRAIKPLVVSHSSSGSLSAGVAAKPTLAPKTVKPLALSGIAGLFNLPAATVAATGPRSAGQAAEEATGTAVADDAQDAAAVRAAPAPKPALTARQLKPLSVGQLKPAASGLFGGAAAAAVQPAASNAAQQPGAGGPQLGRGKPSAAGSLLAAPGSSGAGSSSSASATAAVRASFALPFSFAAAQPAGAAAAAAAAAVEPDPSQPVELGTQEDAAGADGVSPPSQRSAIRAAVDAMRAGGGSAQQPQQQQQSQGQAAAPATERVGGGELGEFMPLPVSERYGKGAVKRRQAQEQQPNGGKKARRQAQAQQQQQSQHLKQTMVELGLEDASGGEEEEPFVRSTKRPQQQQQHEAKGRKKQQQQQPGIRAEKQQQGGAAATAPPAALQHAAQTVDYKAAKSKFDLGIVNPHSLALEQREAGRGGRSGRGRGGRDSGGGGGRGGRGGRGRGGKEDPLAHFPAGKFNPTANPEFDAVKGGKRSSVHARSGNRTMSYK